MTDLIRRILDSRPIRSERGGVAMVMAVPLTTSALKMTQTLSTASRVYDKRLEGMYNANAGVEAAIYEVLTDPTFDDDMTPASPSKEFTVDVNDDTIFVTVTKIFSDEALQGQGIIVSKTVSPTTAPINTTTTLTYTLAMTNEGTATSTLIEIFDFLPPGFTHVADSTTGATTNNPDTFERSVMRSSVMPSEKYPCSGSPLRLSKGKTAIDGLSGMVSGSLVACSEDGLPR